MARPDRIKFLMMQLLVTVLAALLFFAFGVRSRGAALLIVGGYVIVGWLLSRYARFGPKPGHCRCGYDLSGIEGYQCPECGQERTGD